MRPALETMLVGDSLGMVLQGHDSTIPVTMDHMSYHTECVCRAANGALVIADMPFMTYTTPTRAAANATRLMQAGAQMVKMEGGTWLRWDHQQTGGTRYRSALTWALPPVSEYLWRLFQRGKVRAAAPAEAKVHPRRCGGDQDAGASLLVLNGSGQSRRRHQPQAGTFRYRYQGGPGTDAQVLVMHDLLGLTAHTARCPEFHGGRARSRAPESVRRRRQGRHLPHRRPFLPVRRAGLGFHADPGRCRPSIAAATMANKLKCALTYNFWLCHLRSNCFFGNKPCEFFLKCRCRVPDCSSCADPRRFGNPEVGKP